MTPTEHPVTRSAPAQSIICFRAARGVQGIARGGPTPARAFDALINCTAPPSAAEDRTIIHSLIHVPDRGGGPTGPGHATHPAPGT